MARLFGLAVEQARAAIRDAGKDDTRFDGYTGHSNRHTFAGRLVMAGVGARTLQVLGGWKTLRTVGRYSHLHPDYLRAAVERLVAPAQPESSRKVNTEPAIAAMAVVS